MVQRTGTRALKFVFGDLLGDVVYFPVWWYSRGAARAVKVLASGMRATLASLALVLWIKNLFVPMFGQYDLQGRIISFFMRIFQIIARTLAALFWLIVRLAVLGIYLLLPPFVVWMTATNIIRLLEKGIAS